MKKKLIALKQVIAGSLFAAVLISGSGISSVIALSGAAIASADNELSAPVSSSAPYISATSGLGTISFDTDGKPEITHDTFLVAKNAPVQSTSAGMQVVRATVVAREMYVASTGYNSEKGQTDDSPFITANGEHVYWGGVAANFLPFGTKIKIPDYYGDQIFTVNDRMNKRYYERVDIWFPEHKQAINWGMRKKVRIVVLAS